MPHTVVEGDLIRWLFLTKPSDSKRLQFSECKHADMSFITVRSLTSGISLLPCALHVSFVFLARWHARLSSSGCVSGTALPGSHANLALFSFIPSETDRCTNTQIPFFVPFPSLQHKIHNYPENEQIVCMRILMMWFFTLFKQAQQATLNTLRFYSNLGLPAFTYTQTAWGQPLHSSRLHLMFAYCSLL